MARTAAGRESDVTEGLRPVIQIIRGDVGQEDRVRSDPNDDHTP